MVVFNTLRKKKSASIRLASSTVELLEQAQQLLSNFGIASRIYKNRRPSRVKLMPDGKGGMKEYSVQAEHELIISRANMVNFRDEIGFVLDRKQQQLEDMLKRLYSRSTC